MFDRVFDALEQGRIGGLGQQSDFVFGRIDFEDLRSLSDACRVALAEVDVDRQANSSADWLRGPIFFLCWR